MPKTKRKRILNPLKQFTPASVWPGNHQCNCSLLPHTSRVECSMTIRHYGWPSSPFSAKTRAYLKSVGVDFQDIQPHVLTLYRRIQPAIGYVMMPTVELTDGRFLQDSSRIIDHFEALPSTPTILPTTPKQRLASALLEIYADEWLPLIAMCTRWTIPENRHFAQSDFGRCAFPWLPSLLSRPFAKTMAKKMSSYLPILGITEDTTPEILSWLQSLTDQLNKHFSTFAYLFGNRPSLADFSLAAPLFAHVWRDPLSALHRRQPRPLKVDARSPRWSQSIRKFQRRRSCCRNTASYFATSARGSVSDSSRNFSSSPCKGNGNGL